MMAMEDRLRAVVGGRIRAVRRARQMSAQDLADRLGWPLDTLVNYEYGRRPIQLDRLAAVAEALAISPVALLIADASTANIVARLAEAPDLARDVSFFIDALLAEGEQPSIPTGL